MTDEKIKLFIAAFCIDHAGDEPARLRKELAAAHLAYIESIMGHILLAGPLFDSEREDKKTIGSLLVYKTQNMEEARAWLEQDPYYAANIWQSTELRIFRGAAGDAVGGRAW